MKKITFVICCLVSPLTFATKSVKPLSITELPRSLLRDQKDAMQADPEYCGLSVYSEHERECKKLSRKAINAQTVEDILPPVSAMFVAQQDNK